MHDYNIHNKEIEEPHTVKTPKELSPAEKKMQQTAASVSFTPARRALTTTVSKINRRVLLGAAKTTFPKKVAENIEKAKGKSPWSEAKAKPSASTTQHKISQPGGLKIGLARLDTKTKAPESAKPAELQKDEDVQRKREKSWEGTSTRVSDLFSSSTPESTRVRTISETVRSFAKMSLPSITSSAESPTPTPPPSEKTSVTSKEETKTEKEKWLDEIRPNLYDLDPEFDTLKENFLLTYRWHTDTSGLIQQLSDDFQNAKGDDYQRQGILSIFLQWLKDPNIHSHEYEKPEIALQLQNFINEIENEDNKQIHSIFSYIKETFENLTSPKDMPKKIDVVMLNTPVFRTTTERTAETESDPATFVKEAVLAGEGIPVGAKRTMTITKKEQIKKEEINKRYEKNVEAFERDLAIWGQQLMAKVEISEFAKLGWSSKKAETTSPNILKMIEEHNRISNFIVFTILDQDHLTKKTKELKQAPIGEAKKASSEEQIKNAAKTIEYFIDVASKALENNNNFALAIIISALEKSAISRMHNVWKQVSPDRMTKLQNCKNLLDLEHDFKNLRNKVKDIDPQEFQHSTLTLLLYLSEFTHIQEKSELSSKKIESLAMLTKEIISFKSQEDTPKKMTTDLAKIQDLENEKFKALDIKKTEGQTGAQFNRKVDTAAHNLSLAFQPSRRK